MPPYSNASASAAAHKRRCRSFNNLLTRLNRRRTVASMHLLRMENDVPDLPQTCNTNFWTVPYGVFGAVAGFGTALSCESTCKMPFRWAIRGPKRSMNSVSMNSPSMRLSKLSLTLPVKWSRNAACTLPSASAALRQLRARRGLACFHWPSSVAFCLWFAPTCPMSSLAEARFAGPGPPKAAARGPPIPNRAAGRTPTARDRGDLRNVNWTDHARPATSGVVCHPCFPFHF